MKELELPPANKESDRLRLNRLRNDITQAEADLSAANIELERRQTEIKRLEHRIRFRIGRYVDRLDQLERDIDDCRSELARRSSPMDTNAGYLPVEEQYRHVWEPPTVERSKDAESEEQSNHLDLTDEKQVKRLYRQLARRYHPDLAQDSSELSYRTKKMAALNEAYAARSLTEMAAMASESGLQLPRTDVEDQIASDMAAALEKKLAQIKQHINEIMGEIQILSISPIVQLSLESKLAEQAGRDLLGEMIIDLRQKISAKERERDYLKSRLDQLL